MKKFKKIDEKLIKHYAKLQSDNKTKQGICGSTHGAKVVRER